MKEGKADGVGQGRVEGGGGLERRASTGRRLSTQAAPTGGRRSSGAVEAQNTIWEFFEEGRKKGTCKTCGYVVGIKHNHGGLTRFQKADLWNQTISSFPAGTSVLCTSESTENTRPGLSTFVFGAGLTFLPASFD